jgi:DNA ligase (NAD+)
MTRSEAEEIVRRLGGSTTSRVSGKTNLLVVGANPGSKFDEARKRGIRVIDEEKFISMVKEAGADV